MVPKEELTDLRMKVCFGTVINDMIPKAMKKFQTKHFSFGIVVNDMTSKEIVHLLYLGICFETVINDMDQKNTMLFVKNI